MPVNNLQVIDTDSILNLHYKISTMPNALLNSKREVKSFDVLTEELRLKLTESAYLFDDSCKLVLPKSK
jgi:hypothetical protein